MRPGLERRRDPKYTGKKPDPTHPDRRKLIGYCERPEELGGAAKCDHRTHYPRPCSWCDKEIARRFPRNYAGG